MSYIIERIVETTRLRIEPVNGHTTQDVCRLLNEGYATVCYLGPEVGTNRAIVLQDERGFPDLAKVVAHVEDVDAATAGIPGYNWKPDRDNWSAEQASLILAHTINTFEQIDRARLRQLLGIAEPVSRPLDCAGDEATARAELEELWKSGAITETERRSVRYCKKWEER